MKFIKYFIFELRLRFRNPAQIFFIFIFPLFLMFAFMSSFGKSEIGNFIAVYMLYGVLSASVTSMSVQIAEYQSGKIYQLFRQRGVGRLTYMMAQILSFMVVIFLSSLAVLALAHFGYDYHLPSLSTLIFFYVKLYLYTIPFYFVAIIVGLLSKNSATASAIALPVMFISYFLSGMMMPLQTMSGQLRHIADNFFLTQLLSDLTATLTKSYTVTPNWRQISGSIMIIILISLYVYHEKK
ncbi:MAG: ABC transporter permease [Streptococcaceae bacterium]|nr:ABC transporter permease [Streptococcaceae bacterium]MCL2681179.1 ABC transporter permease [Streptococcaceae bacterium]MCL2858432.1 ABC transporter permease [Streptococcaceae bacterium]